MNTSLINETNTKLNEIIEHLKEIKDQYEAKLANNKSQIDDELAKVDEYKSLFYEAKKKIQKMSDDINGFEEDYRNLVEKFQDDELANILTGVSKEINAKIKEKKRNIQKDQQEMNALIDKAQDAKKSLVKLTAEKKGLENTLRQVTDVYKYYGEEFERISMYTSENFDNLHPDDEAFDTENVEKEINIDDIEIDEKEEILSDEDIESSDEDVVELEINEPTPDTEDDDEEYDDDYSEEEFEEDNEEYDDGEFEEAIEESDDSEEVEENDDSEEVVDDEKEIVFSASEGGYFGTSYMYDIEKNDDTYIFTYREQESDSESYNQTINKEDEEYYDSFINELSGIVSGWNVEYINNSIMDGTSWQIVINDINFKSMGSNEFPKEYDEAMRVINKYFKVNRENEEEQLDFDVDNIVVNDDLEDDDEESIKSFLNKDENDLF